MAVPRVSKERGGEMTTTGKELRLTAKEWEQMARINRLHAGKKRWKDYSLPTKIFTIIFFPIAVVGMMIWFGACLTLCVGAGVGL